MSLIRKTLNLNSCCRCTWLDYKVLQQAWALWHSQLFQALNLTSHSVFATVATAIDDYACLCNHLHLYSTTRNQGWWRKNVLPLPETINPKFSEASGVVLHSWVCSSRPVWSILDVGNRSQVLLNEKNAISYRFTLCHSQGKLSLQALVPPQYGDSIENSPSNLRICFLLCEVQSLQERVELLNVCQTSLRNAVSKVLWGHSGQSNTWESVQALRWQFAGLDLFLEIVVDKRGACLLWLQWTMSAVESSVKAGESVALRQDPDQVGDQEMSWFV